MGGASPATMKSDEGNDSLVTLIRQAISKEPLFSFSRTGDGPVQWLQLLHGLEQQAASNGPAKGYQFQAFTGMINLDLRRIDLLTGSTSTLGTSGYTKLVQDLHRVNILTLSADEKLVFFLNLYNAMAIHAVIRVGHPRGMIDRRSFFSDFQYIVGGYSYSLSSIKDGILRSNRRSPFALMKHFLAETGAWRAMESKLMPESSSSYGSWASWNCAMLSSSFDLAELLSVLFIFGTALSGCSSDLILVFDEEQPSSSLFGKLKKYDVKNID
ncbi:hypothetical protein BC332_20960 [Capsicum chinense]|nr:hypothetical protein BC332_20960 [Capsicum chinense]